MHHESNRLGIEIICAVALMLVFVAGLSLPQGRNRERLLLTVGCGLSAVAWMYCLNPLDFAPNSSLDDFCALLFGVSAIAVAIDASMPDPPSFTF